MNEGITSTMLGLRPWPRQAEEIMVWRNILLAELSGVQAAHSAREHGGVGRGDKMGEGAGNPRDVRDLPAVFLAYGPGADHL